MIDTIKGLFDPFKERFKSHFYGAFIGSWLLVNWEIVLVIFTNITLPDNQNTFEFIKNQTSNVKLLLLYPFVFSLVYILILPWIDTISVYYKDWVMKIRSQGSKKILKDGFVSTDLYLKYREAYEEKLRQLEKYTGEQEKEIKDKLELQRAVSELEQKIKDEQILQHEKNNYRKDTTLFFRGRWKLTYSLIENSKEEVERFVVNNNQYFVINDNNEKVLAYNIALFDEEPTGKISFLKYNTTGSCKYRIVNIYRNNKNENVYEGREYWYSPEVLADKKPVKIESKVKYERIFETD